MIAGLGETIGITALAVNLPLSEVYQGIALD
jgi:hypothetical protein